MNVTTIDLDLAKNAFQVHGITADDEVAFNRALRRALVLAFCESRESLGPAAMCVASTGRTQDCF